MSQRLFKYHQNFYGGGPILFPETLEVLSDLKKNYKLGLISNGSTMGQNKKIDV